MERLAWAVDLQPLLGFVPFRPNKLVGDGINEMKTQQRLWAERQHIRAVLEGADGRVDGAAKLLEVSRSTLLEKDAEARPRN